MKGDKKMKKKYFISSGILCCTIALFLSSGALAEDEYTTTVQEEVEAYASTVTDFTYTSKNNQITITGYTGSDSVVIIPASINGFPVTSIASSAFKNNTMITSVKISEGVTDIGAEAFSGCLSLTDVTIPSTVTKLGSSSRYDNGAFENCQSLSSVTITAGTKEAFIGTKAFYGCKSLRSIKIPGNYISIKENAFGNCELLNSLVFEKNTLTGTRQSIDANAFINCEKLKTLSLPVTLQTIGNKAFYNCSSLRMLEVPEGVTEIGYEAFAECKALYSVSLPSTLVKLGSTSRYDNGAFENCKSLSVVTIAAGNQDSYIGTYTFRNCNSLKSINIPGNYTVVYDGAFYNNDSLAKVVYNQNKSTKTAQQIKRSAFENCDVLSEVNLSTSLSFIDYFAFADCISLKKIVIPEGVNTIGYGAFLRCTSLESASFPASLKTLGSTSTYNEGAFENCTALSTVTFKAGTEAAYIGTKSFRNTAVASVTIPGNYKTIYDNAFQDCSKLISLIYQKSSVAYSDQVIKSRAFMNTRLTSVSLSSSLSLIELCAFEDCTALTSIVIPEGVTEIGFAAFQNCSSLVSVKLPSTLEKLGTTSRYDDGVFKKCIALKSVAWAEGESDAYIGTNTFMGCSALTEISIPGNVENIYDSAFKDCTALTKFMYAKGLYGYANQNIYANVFSNNTALSKVYIPSTVGSINEGAFTGCGAVTVYGKKGSTAETFASKYVNLTFQEYDDDISFTLDTTGVIDSGKTLTLTAKGGASYKFLIYNPSTNAWFCLRDYNTSNTFKWTSSGSGTRILCVDIKDAYGNVTRLQQSIEVKQALGITASSNKSSAAVGDTVKINAAASGGAGGYTYSYLIHNKDTNQWSRLTSNFITSNTYTWTAGSAGNREFFIEVKDKTGKVIRSSAVNVSVSGKPLAITGKISTSTAVKGAKVTVGGTASGGAGSYTYSYLIHNKDTNEWSRLTPNFVTSNTYIWTAGNAGRRELFVEVKDSTGKIVRSSALNVSVTANTALTITGKTSASTVVEGGKVTISGTAAGGNGSYTYSFLVHNKDTNAWSRLTSFGKNSSYTWTAGSKGNREFFVEVKDGTGKVVRSKAVNVRTEAKVSPLSIVAGTSAAQGSVGSKITLFASAEGGNGGYTYSYLVHNKDTNAWSRLTSFTNNNVFTWTAGSRGNREFFVEAKDSAGKVVRSKAVNVNIK